MIDSSAATNEALPTEEVVNPVSEAPLEDYTTQETVPTSPAVELDPTSTVPKNTGASFPEKDKPEIAKVIQAAAQGKFTLEEAARQLYSEGLTPDSVRKVAAATIAQDVKEATILFNKEAALGALENAENLARYIQARTVPTQRPLEKDMSVVAKEAATNVILQNPVTRTINKAKVLSEAVKREGSNKAIELMATARLHEKGKIASGWEMLEGIGIVGGTIAAGGLVGAAVSGLIAGGWGLYGVYDTRTTIPKAIEKLTGIKKEEWGVAKQLAQFKTLLQLQTPEEASRLIDRFVDEIAKSEKLPGSLGKLNTFLNVSRLFDDFEDSDWSRLQLSAKTNDLIDTISLGADGIGALIAFKKAWSASKVYARLAGGSRLGEKVGKELVAAADATLVPKEGQVDAALSFSLDNVLPDGVNGMSAKVQQELKSDLDKTIATLQDRIALDGDPEARKLLAYIQQTAESHNGAVANINAVTGEILLQHPRGAPYASIENATGMQDYMEKTLGIKLDIVPANEHAADKILTVSEMGLGEGRAARYRVALPDLDNGDMIQAFENARMMGGDMRATDILAELSADYASDRRIAESAKFILDMAPALDNVKVKFVETLDDWKKVPGFDPAMDTKGLHGQYNWRSNTIFLLRDASTSPSLFIHEVTHAAVSQVIDIVRSGDKKAMAATHITGAQKAAVANLQELYKDIKYHIHQGIDTGDFSSSTLGERGLHDMHEMVSEALSNPAFVDVLKKITLSEDTLETMKATNKTFLGTVRTAWDAFTKLVSQMLGIPLSKENAYSRVLEESARLIRNIDLTQQNTVKTLQKAGMPNAEIAKMLDNSEKAMRAEAPSHGYYLKHAGTRGVHTEEDIFSRWGAGLDPVHRASAEAYDERVFTMLNEQKDKAALTTLVSKHINPLSRKEAARVSAVLEEGNDVGKEFSVVELAARGLTTEKEQKAYYAYRTVNNLSLALKNETGKANLARAGFVQGIFRDGLLSSTGPAKRVGAESVQGKLVYNLITNSVERVDEGFVSGKTFIVEMHTPYNVKGAGEFRYVIGDESVVKFGQLQNPIPARAGHFSRIYTHDVFGKVVAKTMLDGAPATKDLHMRTSMSMKDMNKWAAGMNRILELSKTNPAALNVAEIDRLVGRWESPEDIMKQIQAGDWADYTKFESHWDRGNDDHVQSLVKAMHSNNPEWWAERGEKLRALDYSVNTLDPIKSMQAEIGSVARYRNIDEWRDKWVNTWWNSFKDLLPPSVTSGKSPLAAMSDPSIQTSVYSGDSAINKFAESQRKYILQMLGAQTMDERLLTETLRRATASFSQDTGILGYGKGKILTAGYLVRQADPFQFMRSLNFTAMLGLFNPSQLFVQAAGAFNAMAISPVHGMKAAYSAPLLRVALASDNPDVWKTAAGVSKAMKLGLEDEAEFIKTVQAIRKSGLLSNISGTAMHSAETGKFNILAGAVGKLGEKTSFFFNRGEEFARLVSFDIAKREYVAANPKLDWASDEGLRAILARADNFTQHMGRANAAFYQRGVLSIPGQFLQYNIKLGANLIGAGAAWARGVKTGTAPVYRGYTVGEALRLAGFHMAAYGLIGNGMTNLYDETMGTYEGIIGREATADERLFFSQGAFAAVLNEMAQAFGGEDMRLAVGSRLGVGDFYERLTQGLYSGDAGFWEVVLGPTMGTATRSKEALAILARPFVRGDLTKEGVLSALNDSGKTFATSWSNAAKGWYAMNNEGALLTKQGDTITTLTPYEMVAQALGVGSAGEKEAWIGIKAKLTHHKEMKEMAATWVSANKQYLEALAAGDEKRAESLGTFLGTVVPSSKSMDWELFWDEVKRAEEDGKGTYKNTFQKLRATYLEGYYSIKDVPNTSNDAFKTRAPLVQGKE